MAPLRGLPLLLEEGMRICLTPPALKRERFSIVEALSEVADGARVLFSCSRNLDDAEGLVGCYLLARESDLDLDPLDIAFDDLVGREVIDERHGALGAIQQIMETPANDVWVVEGAAYGEVLIPVFDDVVREVPVDGPISVRIMDGLLDL